MGGRGARPLMGGTGWAFASPLAAPGSRECVRAPPPRPEEEAGWTTEESPEGLEVLKTEHSSGNVLAQYLHNLFKLHFPFKKFVFLRLAGGKRRSLETKTNQFPHM